MAGVFTEGDNDAVAAVLERNIADKKPHRVVRSARDRYTVGCKDPACLYSVAIRKRLDGLRRQPLGCKSGWKDVSSLTCRALVLTIKAASEWIWG